MFERIVNSLGKALTVVRHRSQLQFILILLVVFPLLFTFVWQQFLSVATNQIEYTLKQTISHDHDAIAALLNSELSPEEVGRLLVVYTGEDSLTTVVQLVRDDGPRLIVAAGTQPETVGTTIADDSFYKSAIAHSGSSVIYPYLRNGEREWYSYRAVTVGETQWYIYSQISLATIDTMLAKQASQANLGLIVVFLFLGILAWWFWRQYDYKAAWQQSKEKLQEQFGFTNMMVHELRAPLTAIRGYASLISEAQSLPPDQMQYVERISTSTDRLVRLVSDFLEVARIQAGTLSVTFTEADIRDTITTVVQEMTPSAEAKNLKLTFTVPTNAVTIATDMARLHQVVTNLLSNAIKYTNEGGISVVLNHNPRGVELRIQDTGHGISAKDQAQLFQPFKRVGEADTSGEVGSGLGMWITKQLVALLGGDVSIESIENVGTHAVVRLYNKGKKN